MRESAIRSALKAFAKAGLIDRTNGPALTDAGRAAVESSWA
jgi:hypothetical protein